MLEFYFPPQHGLHGVGFFQLYEEGAVSFSLWIADPVSCDGETGFSLFPRYVFPEWRGHWTLTQAALIAYAKHRWG